MSHTHTPPSHSPLTLQTDPTPDPDEKYASRPTKDTTAHIARKASQTPYQPCSPEPRTDPPRSLSDLDVAHPSAVQNEQGQFDFDLPPHAHNHDHPHPIPASSSFPSSQETRSDPLPPPNTLYTGHRDRHRHDSKHDPRFAVAVALPRSPA